MLPYNGEPLVGVAIGDYSLSISAMQLALQFWIGTVARIVAPFPSSRVRSSVELLWTSNNWSLTLAAARLSIGAPINASIIHSLLNQLLLEPLGLGGVYY
ncbi:MAG: hypothetical protein ACFFFC_10190 [Candidatus Thorarchaeota archaeon]